jgi:oligopeptide transport system ATP-binding protein
MDICRSVKPELAEVEPGRMVACHLYNNPIDAGATGASEANERNQQGVNQ